jgi:hypothetical protein
MTKLAKKEEISISFDSLKSKSKEEVIRLLLSQNDILIPVTVFSAKLSPFTALVKYLYHDKGLSAKEIAARLNRHEQTIYTIIHLAKKIRFVVKPANIFLPLSIFSKEKFSILETLVAHLKDENKLSLTEISVLLNKNVKTIWTCYSRNMIKGGKK